MNMAGGVSMYPHNTFICPNFNPTLHMSPTGPRMVKFQDSVILALDSCPFRSGAYWAHLLIGALAKHFYPLSAVRPAMLYSEHRARAQTFSRWQHNQAKGNYICFDLWYYPCHDSRCTDPK